MAVTTAKQAEKETEKSFGRRLHRLAIRAGNVIEKRDITTIYVEGLPTFVQAGLRMHLTPGMTFETVQRSAHNLGISLRQAVAQPVVSSLASRQPMGVKSLITRPVSVHAVESPESSSIGIPPSEDGGYLDMEALVAAAHAVNGYSWSPLGAQPSWKQTDPRSSSPSVVSIPTRGWVSPGGSVMSEPSSPSRPRVGYLPRTGISKPPPLFPLLRGRTLLSRFSLAPGYPTEGSCREPRRVSTFSRGRQDSTYPHRGGPLTLFGEFSSSALSPSTR
jgi:hypothetical protein